MQKLTTAATLATSHRQTPQGFRNVVQQKNQTQTRKKQAEQNVNDENLGQHYYKGKHSQNPSFSVTSDISRQLNQSVSEGKYRIRSGQSSMTQCELSISMANQRKPQEIEDLFESTRNFYHNNNSNHRAVTNTSVVGYRENQQMLTYQRTVFSDQKNTLNTQGVMPQNTSQNYVMKMSTASSTRKQGPSAKVAKKQCKEEDYNTLITYKEKGESSNNSIGSSISASPSNTDSLQKHHEYESNKHKAPCTLKGLEFQTFSIPSSTQSNKMLQEIKNISHTINSRAQINKTYMKDKTPLHNVQPGTQMKLALSSERGSIINQRAQLTSLDSCRLQQKLMKQQENITEPKAKHQLADIHQPMLSSTLHLSIDKYILEPLLCNQRSVMDRRPSHNVKVPVTRLNLAQPLQVSKIQDKPQAKKLNESSDEETIDSHDMSNSRIGRELREDCDRYEIFKNKDITQIQVKVDANDTASRLQTTQSLHQDQIASQTNVPLSATSKVPNLNSLNANNYRSTSSASKRAKWDLSASKLQNSGKKGGSDSDAPLLQCKLSSKQQTDEESQKFQELHKQYMAIKKQLMELQITKKKSQRNEITYEDDRMIVGVLSPDRAQSSDSNLSSDPHQNNSYDEDLIDSKKNKSQIQKHRTIDHNHKPYQKTYLKTHEKAKKRKQEGTHFKSLDVQFLPQILQSSLKQDKQQSQQNNNFGTAYHTNHNQAESQSNKKRQSNDQDYSYLQRASAMKSQLQIGLRKLSINKQCQDQEAIFKQLKKQQNGQVPKNQRNTNKSVLKTSQSGYNHKKQNSQVSFVDVKSDSSDDHYKDYLSGQRSLGRSRCMMPRCGSVMSNESSQYYLANDEDQSICSCCQDEINHQTSKNRKSNRKSQKQIGGWLQPNKSGEKIHPFKSQKQSTYRNQQAIDYYKETYDYQHSNRNQDYRQQNCKESERRREKGKKVRQISKNNLESKFDERSEIKKSQRKVKKDQSRSKSKEKRRMSNDNKASNNYAPNLDRTLQMNMQQNSWLTQQLLNQYHQNSSIQHHIAPNFSIYQQSLHTPQVMTQSVSPGANYQMFLPNQIPMQSSIYQNIPQVSHISSFNQNIRSPNSGLNNVNLPLQLQNLESQQPQSLEQHKEQIETIEQLIKVAKFKLETNLNVSDKVCRIPDQSQFRETSRNNDVQQYNSYSSSQRQNYNSNLMFRTQGSAECSEIQHQDSIRQVYSQQKDKENHKMMQQRRFSEQQNNFPLQRPTHQGNLLFSGGKEQRHRALEIQDYLESEDQTKVDSQQLMFNQTLRSIGNVPQTKQKDIKRNNNMPLQKDDQNKEKLMWIDFNDGKQLHKQKPQVKQNKIGKASANTTTQRLPQSIPEERDEDYHSPEQAINKLTFGFKPRYDKEISSVKNRDSAWAMDFTEKADSKEASNFSEAFKQRLESNERRFKKKEVDIKSKQKKEFTKEELLERKKEMLKSAREKVKKNQISDISQQQEELPKQNSMMSTKVIKIDISKACDSIKNPHDQSNDNLPLQLVSRLSQGQKPDISKKDMLKLTSKNYEQLPEIQKRKQELSKKEDLKKRLDSVKELEKKRRQTIVIKRNTMLKSQQASTKTLD